MEIKIINLPFIVDTNTVLIAKASADNIPRVEEFVTNYAIEYRGCLNDNLCICYQQCEGCIQILGIFSFRNNIPPFKNVEDSINCNELSFLISDLRIITLECLEHIFSIILPMLVNKDDNNDEGIWLNYQGSLNAKRIDKLFKTCGEYYYQNELEYFASKILEIKQQIDNNNRRIDLLLNR